MVSEEDYLIFSGIKPGGEYLTLTIIVKKQIGFKPQINKKASLFGASLLRSNWLKIIFKKEKDYP